MLSDDSFPIMDLFGKGFIFLEPGKEGCVQTTSYVLPHDYFAIKDLFTEGLTFLGPGQEACCLMILLLFAEGILPRGQESRSGIQQQLRCLMILLPLWNYWQKGLIPWG